MVSAICLNNKLGSVGGILIQDMYPKGVCHLYLRNSLNTVRQNGCCKGRVV